MAGSTRNLKGLRGVKQFPLHLWVKVKEMDIQRNRLFLKALCLLPLLVFALGVAPALVTQEPVSLSFDRTVLEEKWSVRIRSFLDKGIIPLIDLESSLVRGFGGGGYLEDTVKGMDELGEALLALFTFQAPEGRKKQKKGYRWNYYIHEVVNQYPDYFILSTNGGVNKNWFKQKNSYIKQLEQHVRSGAYPIMSEIEFRHYLSDLQCRLGRKDRDINIPINSENGHRLFKLSEETGVAFVIHFELEDELIASLEEMLETYPKAKVVIALFGQIRHRERQRRFGPQLVRHLLSVYPNLYFDLSTGEPGRRYSCTNELDTVIWENGILGSQKNTLKPKYKEILIEFSNRFVVGLDYGGGKIRKSQKPPTRKLKRRVENIRLIMRDLPPESKHNISYRNAWFLLTGDAWR